jgi:hypothetical protein
MAGVALSLNSSSPRGTDTAPADDPRRTRPAPGRPDQVRFANRLFSAIQGHFLDALLGRGHQIVC